MHLVGFIIEIYHDAGSHGRQNINVNNLNVQRHFFVSGRRETVCERTAISPNPLGSEFKARTL